MCTPHATAAAAPQYFADALPDENDTATAEGGAGGLAADAAGWKYWEQPSDGSEFMCPYNVSGAPEVLDWGDGNKQPSARECSKSCKCALTPGRPDVPAQDLFVRFSVRSAGERHIRSVSVSLAVMHLF